MKPRYWLIIGALCLVAFGAGFGVSVTHARPNLRVASQATPVNHLLVYAQEWSLYPSRTRIPAGTIDVQLTNRGMDAHDVYVRAINSHKVMVGRVLGTVKTTQSGGLGTGVWHLKAGHYEIYCSLPGHMKMGMHADITVTAVTR